MDNHENLANAIVANPEEVENWKRIIAELVENAPNNTIRECLRSYNPELATQQNSKSLKALRKDTIHESLSYLCKGAQFSNNKNDLIDKLCLRIKNFFPDICQICKSKYVYKIETQLFT